MKIAFVYSEGRIGRFAEAVQGPSEFFYGAREFQADGHEVTLLETGPEVVNVFTKGFNAISKTFVPARGNGSALWQAHAMLPQLQDFDCVVAAYSQSALGLGFWKNLGRLLPPLVGIHCGLVNYPLPPLRRKSTAWLLQKQSIALFAQSEFSEMQRRYGLSSGQMRSCEFGVDLSFWKPDPAEVREDYVLAVGNDGRRDYETLVAAAADVPCEVRVVTKRVLPESLPANVRVWRGDWHRQALTDEELRTQYRRALCVVVPLLDSLQPSGQSVAMQAMACGTPVIISRTSGYWGDGWLEEGRDLLVVPSASPAALSLAINSLRDQGRAEAMGRNGLAAMHRQGGARNFADNLLSLCRDAVAGGRSFSS